MYNALEPPWAVLESSWGKGFPAAVASNLAESLDDSDLARLPHGGAGVRKVVCGCCVRTSEKAVKLEAELGRARNNTAARSSYRLLAELHAGAVKVLGCEER